LSLGFPTWEDSSELQFQILAPLQLEWKTLSMRRLNSRSHCSSDKAPIGVLQFWVGITSRTSRSRESELAFTKSGRRSTYFSLSGEDLAQ
jgi:hypothetical protein